jgi:hypothetical protein
MSGRSDTARPQVTGDAPGPPKGRRAPVGGIERRRRLLGFLFTVPSLLFILGLFLVPLDHPGITINPIWTMGDERTNDVFFDDVWVSDDYVVGELNRGFQYISEALDLERFTMFTFPQIAQRLELLCEYVAVTTRDGRPLRDDPVVRQRIAQLV